VGDDYSLLWVTRWAYAPIFNESTAHIIKLTLGREVSDGEIMRSTTRVSHIMYTWTFSNYKLQSTAQLVPPHLIMNNTKATATKHELRSLDIT
jgi:hypothetical protein